MFYEKGLHLAIEQILHDLSAKWPATYSDKMFHAHGHNGQLSFQTKSIPQWDVYCLEDTIHHHLDLNDSFWARGLVFLHEIHGVNHSSFHSSNTHSADMALELFLQMNDLHNVVLGSGEWWFNIGIEISSEDKNCLSWRTDSHVHLVQAALKINNHTDSHITSIGSSKYTQDLVSHMSMVQAASLNQDLKHVVLTMSNIFRLTALISL